MRTAAFISWIILLLMWTKALGKHADHGQRISSQIPNTLVIDNFYKHKFGPDTQKNKTVTGIPLATTIINPARDTISPVAGGVKPNTREIVQSSTSSYAKKTDLTESMTDPTKRDDLLSSPSGASYNATARDGVDTINEKTTVGLHEGSTLRGGTAKAATSTTTLGNAAQEKFTMDNAPEATNSTEAASPVPSTTRTPDSPLHVSTASSAAPAQSPSASTIPAAAVTSSGQQQTTQKQSPAPLTSSTSPPTPSTSGSRTEAAKTSEDTGTIGRGTKFSEASGSTPSRATNTHTDSVTTQYGSTLTSSGATTSTATTLSLSSPSATTQQATKATEPATTTQGSTRKTSTLTGASARTTSAGDTSTEPTSQKSGSRTVPTASTTASPKKGSTVPSSWTFPTTDYASARKGKTTTPSPVRTSSEPTSQRTTTTNQKEEEPTTHAYCKETCPKNFFEGLHGCIAIMDPSGGAYSKTLGRCQELPNGDMISWLDIKEEFAAISKMMKYYDIPEYKFFVNAYNTDLIRKKKSAQIVYISASSYVLAANDSIVHRGQEVARVGAICKIPKHCLRWTCPTSPALLEAPEIEFDLPLPAPFLKFEQTLRYKCKNQSISTKRWEGTCRERGVMSPAGSYFNNYCLPNPHARPVRPNDWIYEEPMPQLRCDMCTRMGTQRCEKTPEGEPDKCHCKEGWTGITCWRFPKFCPNMTCPEESVCEERVDHATCVCATERCVVFQRTFNRTTEMKYLDTAVSIAGPTIEFIIKMAMQVLFPERGDTIQDSLQYMRSIFGSCAGVAYVFGGNPQTLKIDIAERRAMSIMFHFPQILVHLLYALEVCHIDAVMSGRSDNKWKTGGKDKKRWDYAWTYGPTMTLGLAFSIGIWYFNWNTQQREYTSLGVVDGNFGMLGWAAIGYAFCATYSFWKGMDIIFDENRRHHEMVKRDNKYETCHDPKLQENEDKCWRNLASCFIGAPIQCWYSISMLANLAFESRTLKYANLYLLFLNCLIGVMQTIMCDRKFLGRVRAWNMCRKPLEEQYNRYTYLTTSETIALKGRAAYEDMLQKRKEAKEKEMEEKREKHEETVRHFEEKGIPMTFLPHFPLEGPAPCKVYEYDPCEENYMCARERDWKFGHWTNEFLGARVKVGVSVADAIEHVKNGLLDNGFLNGDECPSTQAITMFREWMDMMVVQDRLDYARPNHYEKRFIKNLDKNGFFDDMEGLSVANKVREAPIDPRKRRLMEPVVDMFAYSCTDEMTIGLGLCPDQYGFLWECKVIKDQGCFTRNQEARVWNAIKEDDATDHQRHDKIYTDTERYDKIGGKPYEAALKEFAKVKEAFPEGRDKKSLNPLFGSIDIKMMDQNRPDFIGPRQPQYQIAAGPVLRRFFCERIYRERRDLVFDILGEQAAQRRNNRIIRQNLRAHKKSKCAIM